MFGGLCLLIALFRIGMAYPRICKWGCLTNQNPWRILRCIPTAAIVPVWYRRV